MTNKILRLKNVIEKTGLSRSTIYAYMKEGRFPQAIRLGARAVGWNENDIDIWIEGCQEARGK